MLSCASDRKDALLQDRIRGWLGEGSGEFDLLLIEDAQGAPEAIRDHRNDSESDGTNSERLREAGIEKIFYGLVVLRHGSPDRESFTVRRGNLGAVSAACLESFLQIMTAIATQSMPAALFDARPNLVDGVEVQLLHTVQNGRLTESERVVQMSRPFAQMAKVPALIPQILRCVDGSKTVRELHAGLQASGDIPADFTLADFASGLP
jgi:hypothetical protein